MKKVKKVLAFTCAIVICLTMFGGCGQKTVQIESNGSTVKLNGDKIYPVECDDTLTFWSIPAAQWSHSYENFGDTPLGKKIAENTGIKVEYLHPTGGQGDEQIQLLMASDELPDIVEHEWNNYAGGPDVAIEDGYILKLNDIIDSFAPALKKKLASYEEWDKQSKTDSGAYYAFPYLMETGILQTAYGPMLRGDILRKLNLEIPETIDEWETVLQAFKDNGIEVPFIGELSRLEKAFGSAFNFYPEWYRDGDTVKYSYYTPGYKDYLQKMNEWYKKGYIDKDIAVLDGKEINTKMSNGGAGASIAWLGSGMGVWMKANEGKSIDEYDIVGAKFPVKNKGDKSEYSYMSLPCKMTSGVAISGNCKNIELAARYLDYGFSEEGDILYNFGIEGESFNWVDKNGEKYPQYTDKIMNDPEGQSVANAMGPYMRSCYVGVFVQDTRYMEQYYPTPQQQEAQANWVDTNMANHLLPQIYVSADNSERDSDIMTNVKTFKDEMTIKFITGEKPIEEFDSYMEQLKKFGIEEAIAFRQEAYNKYINR